MLTKPKILIAEPDDFSPRVVERLRQFAEVDLKHWPSDNIKEALQKYDVFWFRLAHKMNHSVFSANMKCKILASPVTGIDHINEDLCQQYGVKICCLRGERAFLREVRATSEMAVGLAIALMRNLPEAFSSVKNGQWERDWFRGNELYKKTAGIIGFGRLGSIVADYFKAFGMQVLAYDPREDIASDFVEFCPNLEHLVSKSDVVTLHVNYTEETEHLINEKVFQQFKPNAVFINTSRGGIVEEAGLLKALKEKWIAGAALDVLRGEPAIDQNNPLVQYSKENNNLLIVPHIGGNTYESFEKTEAFIAEKVIQEIQQWPS